MTRRQFAFLAALALLLLAAGCPGRYTVSRPDAIRVTVEEFLDKMMDDDKSWMEDMLSPAWLEENDIDLADYQLNAYHPESYEVTRVKGNFVTAEITFKSGGVHRLKFRVSTEGGKNYIVPGEVDDDGWIHPWIDVKTDIR